MASTEASVALVNGVRRRRSNSMPWSSLMRADSFSLTESESGAAEAEDSGHYSDAQLSSGTVSCGLTTLLLTGGHSGGERERRASSSSTDSGNSQLRQRRSISRVRKKKCTKKNWAAAAASYANLTEDRHTAQTVSCAECNSDLTDSDVEVCQICFGLRKQSKNSNDEYLPYPFSFIKKTHLPGWMHEPEYMMAPRPKLKRNNSQEGQSEKGASNDIEVHKNTDSLFSTSSGFTNYRGLLNLALILLVLSNTRLFLENLMKYGVLIEPLETVKKCFGNLNNWPNVKVLLCQSVHPLVAFLLELALSKGKIPEAFGVLGHTVNGLVQLTYPAYVVLKEHPSPVFSSITLAMVTVLFLKLISYAHTNYWCRKHKADRSVATRRSRRQSHSGDHNDTVDDRNGFTPLPQPPVVMYPDNLNVKDMLYFVFAPTLCYELNFPRSARIRKRFLLKRVLEMVFLLMVIIGLVQQWIVPTINNAIKPLSELAFFKCMERLLKLSIPNHLIWLMFFYTFFHSMLNVVAELLMFGDRDFYQDWWNAETVSEFWQNWNIPVHRWATRHLYKPIRRRGVGKMAASVVVFMVSAFFHEYLVSVPLRMFKIWAFTGMLMQVPLAYFTSKYMSGKWGNIVVWLSLILGQPVAILAYVHDYYVSTVIVQPVNMTVTEALLKSEL